MLEEGRLREGWTAPGFGPRDRGQHVHAGSTCRVRRLGGDGVGLCHRVRRGARPRAVTSVDPGGLGPGTDQQRADRYGGAAHLRGGGAFFFCWLVFWDSLRSIVCCPSFWGPRRSRRQRIRRDRPL